MFGGRSHLLLVALLSLGACDAALGPVREPKAAGTAPASLFEYPWLWTDEQGHAAAFSRWRGAPLVVTEIYTSCTSTCPRTIAKLRKLSEALRRSGRSAQFLLVTLDPSSDTPERLRIYKQSEALPDSWHLLTGSTRATQELADLLDIHVMDGGSHIVHDAKIAVFDRNGVRTQTLSGSPSDDEGLSL